jgi:hypothetical protein
MTLLNNAGWEIAAGLAAFAALAGAAAWLALRKRPSPEELERARRQFLVQSGRLVDGMLLDISEIEAVDGRTLTMLMFNYRIAGVNYECSQDITGMRDVAFRARRGTSRATRKTASWLRRDGPDCARDCRSCRSSTIRSLLI